MSKTVIGFVQIHETLYLGVKPKGYILSDGMAYCQMYTERDYEIGEEVSPFCKIWVMLPNYHVYTKIPTTKLDYLLSGHEYDSKIIAQCQRDAKSVLGKIQIVLHRAIEVARHVFFFIFRKRS